MWLLLGLGECGLLTQMIVPFLIVFQRAMEAQTCYTTYALEKKSRIHVMLTK